MQYIGIITINFFLLFILLVSGTDQLERKLYFNRTLYELLTIAGYTFLCILLLAIIARVTRKKTRPLMVFCVCLVTTVLASSPLYLRYSKRLIGNRFIHQPFRANLADKIQQGTITLNDIKAQPLNYQEYLFLLRHIPLPTITTEAYEIHVQYQADGFLPDYWVNVTYNIPLGVNVDSINYQKSNYSVYQTWENLGDSKKVVYEAILL